MSKQVLIDVKILYNKLLWILLHLSSPIEASSWSPALPTIMIGSGQRHLTRTTVFGAAARHRGMALSGGGSVIRRFLTSSSAHQTAAATTTEGAVVLPPTHRQLMIVAVRSAIPMVGFGFMDNIVMIQAGDLIDNSIGVTFGLSTLTAAGFGQCVSDVAGFTSGGIVDAAVSKLNLPVHGLSQAQLSLQQAGPHLPHRGRVCRRGDWLPPGDVLPLLHGHGQGGPDEKGQGANVRIRIDHDRRPQTGAGRAVRAVDLIHDTEKRELWSRVATGTKGGDILRIPDHTGVAGAALQESQIVNIRDAYADSRFNPDVDKKTGFRTRSIIAVPVQNDSGRVIGCIQMVNKKNEDWTDGVFDTTDAKLLIMLSSHVKSFTKIVTGEG